MSHYQHLLYKFSSYPALSHFSCAETSTPAFSCSGSLIDRVLDGAELIFLGLGWEAGYVILSSVHSSLCDQMKLKSPGQVMNRNRRIKRATNARERLCRVGWWCGVLTKQLRMCLQAVFIFFNWRNIVLQCCAGFCPTTTQISHNYTSVTYFLSLPPLPPNPPL